MKVSIRKKLIVLFMAVTFVFILGILSYFNLLPQKIYKAEDFGIETIYSKNDYNQNGIDDYTDILLGARKDAENKPILIHNAGQPVREEDALIRWYKSHGITGHYRFEYKPNDM